MREYEKIKIETEELTKVLCDTCKKEIHKCGSGQAYIPPEVITVSRKYSSDGWGSDVLEFCSLECLLEWAKGESVSEYARLKSRDSSLNDTKIEGDKQMKYRKNQ